MINNGSSNVCVKCRDGSGGELTCNGCQQSFCWEHITDHQQDIQKQMDSLVKNNFLVKRDWEDESYHKELFCKIDQWEKESIDKIQVTASIARDDLKSLIKRAKKNLKTTIEQISEQIDKNRQLNHFSEIHINELTEQIKNLHSQIETSFNIETKQDEQTSSIKLIKIKQNIKRQLDQNEQTTKRLRNEINNNLRNEMTTDNERFEKVFETSKLYEENRVAINRIDSRSFISGANSYSNGKHDLHFRIGKVYKKGWSSFFGIMTSNENIQEDISKMGSVYGVWSSGYNVECGKRCGSCGNRRWTENADVILALDCDNKKISIKNKRINWCQILDIDIDLCPFPWKFLTIIKGCRLRINNHS